MPIPAATAIGHVHLRVADLDRARRFYEDLLGFDLVATHEGQVAFLSAGGYHHHVALNTWGSLGGSPPPAGATGLYHFAINVPTRRDLALILRRLLAARWPIGGLRTTPPTRPSTCRIPTATGWSWPGIATPACGAPPTATSRWGRTPSTSTA